MDDPNKKFKEELKVFADKLIAEGVSVEEIQSQLDVKKAEFKEAKTTTVETDAPAEKVIASDTDSPSIDGSSEFSRESNPPTPRDNNLFDIQEDTSSPSKKSFREREKLFEDYQTAIGITPEEELLFDEPIDFSLVTRDTSNLKLSEEDLDDMSNIERDLYNKGFTKETFEGTYLPYLKEQEQAQEILKNPSKFGLNWTPIPNPTEKEINTLASLDIKDKQRRDLIKEKSILYLENLPEKDRKRLLPYKAEKFLKADSKYKDLNEQYNLILEKYSNSTQSKNLNNVIDKFEDKDFKFDLEGLGDLDFVETLAKRIKDLGDPEKFFTKATGELYNNLVKTYNTQLENLKTIRLSNGKIVPKATYDFYQEGLKENALVLSTLKNISKDMEKIELPMSDDKKALEFLKKNYSFAEKQATNFGLLMGAIPRNAAAFIAGYASDLTTIVAEGISALPTLTGAPAQKWETLDENMFEVFRRKVYKKDREIKKAYASKYVADLTLEEGFSSVGNFSRFFMQEAVGQTATFAMLYAGLYPGMVGIGATSYEEQMRVQFDEDAVNLKQGNPLTSRLEKASVAVGFAGLEVGLGFLPTFTILNRGFRSAAIQGKRVAQKAGIKEYMGEGLKAIALGVPIEALTEGATVAGQNYIDIFRGKKGVSIMDNVPHAMAVGGMMGAAFTTTPVIGGLMLRQLSDYDSYKRVRDIIKEKEELQEIAATLDKRTSSFKITEEKWNELNAEQNDIIAQKANQIKENITTQGYIKFRDATVAQEKIRLDVEKTIDDYKKGDITFKEKETILEVLHSQFQTLQKGRNSYREAYVLNINLLNKVDREKYLDLAKTKLELKKPGSYTQEEINIEAEKIYQIETFDTNSSQDVNILNRLKSSGVSTTYKMAENKSQAITFFKEALDARVKQGVITEEKAKQELAAFTLGTNAGTINGTNFLTLDKNNKKSYDIIINRENSINNGKTETGAHELGHIFFIEGLSADSKAFKNIAINVLEYLREYNPNAFTRITENLPFEIDTEGNYMEDSPWDEVLTEFLEEIPRMNLEAKNNEGLLALISQGFPAAFKSWSKGKSNFSLKGGTDVIDFLKTLSVKMKENTLTKKDIKELQEGSIDSEGTTVDAKSSNSATVLATEAVELGGFKNLSSTKQEDLRKQYNNIAKKALGFIEGKGIEGKPKITKAEAISFVALEMEGIIDRFQPGKENQFSTFVDANIRPKQQAFYSKEQKIDKQAFETRLSDERARQVEGTEGADSRIIQAERAKSEAKTEIKRIDVLNFKRAKDKVQELTKAVKLTAVDIASGLTFKNISDKFSGLVGEIIYDIPADRITTNRTLNYSDTVVDGIPVPSEASKIQSKFNNEQEVKNFLKILPPENVSQDTAVVGKQGVIKDVSREFKGISLGLKGRVLNYFYEKTGKRSGGLTSQPGVWKLKPEFINPTDATVIKLQRDMGITGRGELNIPIKAKARTEFGTFIKGIAKLDSGLIALRLATQAIETSPVKTAKPKQQIVADASAGKSKSMFSRSVAGLNLGYRQDFYKKLPKIAKAIEESDVDFKDQTSWKEIKSIILPILGNKFPKLSEISKDLQKYIKQYSIVKENYKNLKILPEQSLNEFLFDESKAAETNTNIIKLLELGKVKMTTLFNNIDNIIKQRLFAKELGNHLINTGMKPAQVARLFVSYYKGMYATSSKIGDGGIVIDKEGNVVKGDVNNIGSPRYQSFSNVNDFVNNVIKQIKGLEDIKLTPSGQVKNKQNIGGIIVDFNLFEETSKSAMQDKDFAGRKAQAKEARKSIDLMMSFMVDKVLDNNSIYTKEDLAMLMASMKSNMQGPIKRAANLKYIYQGKNISIKDLRYEHMIPTNYILLKLVDIYMNNKGSIRDSKVNKLFEQYTVAVIPKVMDDVLAKMKLVDIMPIGYLDGDSSYKRYYNMNTFGAQNMFTIKSIDPKDKGKIIGEQWVAVEKSKQKAKVFNENILPNNIRFAKSDTNQDVINEMERLDNNAIKARSRFSESQDLNGNFNKIIEQATGIGKEKQYGKTKARAVGGTKGRWDWAGIPPSAQDFVGLTRYFAGKGKQGDATIAWVKENFLDPFARANIDISNAQVSLANDFKALKKLMKISPKDLNKKIVGEPYNVGNAVRVFAWTQQGMKVPGLSNADAKILNDYVNADENLETFANQLIAINKDNGYPKPQDSWLAGTITTDLLSGLNTVVRAKYLKQWQQNVNEVFTEANLNKLEAAYGQGYRDALENVLGRMKTGSNRGFKGDTLTGRFVDWLNGSIGAIMFFNMRSAVLQTISAVNFVNWSDNNLLKASTAFANQPQYWGDVFMLMNSDYLVQRRNGLKININEADIAEIAAESKNKAKAFINKILKLGFLPTQIADSFAIASGGATFYRNRVKSLTKDGMAQKEAEAQAFLDFREIAEESQQSSRPDRISKQQAGPMGRVILAFANTPAQYARLMQKAASDLKNRRGDDKTNISKILYYGMIQNVIFNALQQALFAMAFDDEEATDEIKNKKYTSIINGMADSLLRGLGFHGAAVSTLKNVIMKLASGAKAQDAAIEMLDISPPISSKIGKLRSAGRTWDWNKKEIMEKGWSLDNPAWLASGQVISAGTNVPLDRGVRKLQNLIDASNAENEEWMRVANTLGWAKWELEWEKDKKPAVSSSRTRSRSTSRSRSRSRTRD